MSNVQKEYTTKKEGITEALRWRNIVMKEQNLTKTPLILLPPDFLKKECITVCSESKYFVKSSYNSPLNDSI